MCLKKVKTSIKCKFQKICEAFILSISVTQRKHRVVFLSLSTLKFMKLSNAQYISILDFQKGRELITKESSGVPFCALWSRQWLPVAVNWTKCPHVAICKWFQSHPPYFHLGFFSQNKLVCIGAFTIIKAISIIKVGLAELD